MPRLMLSDEEMFAVVESVWATSLGLPAEISAGSADSESSADAASSWKVDRADSAEDSANAGAGSSLEETGPGGEMWTAWVRISGGWDGAIALHCPPELARMAAVSMFRVEPDGATLEDGREALAELINIVGGNLKALLPPPCQSSLPVFARRDLGDEIAQGGTRVAELWASCLGWRFAIELIEAGGVGDSPTGGGQTPQEPNRREFTRVTVDVAMALVTPDRTIQCGRVRDISMNGICCECSETLPVGQPCRAVLFLGDPDDSVHVEAEARVVRSTDGGTEGTCVAVELSEMSLESFHHICALVLNNAADEDEAERDLRNHLGIRSLKSWRQTPSAEQ